MGQSLQKSSQRNRSVTEQGREQHSFPFLRKEKTKTEYVGCIIKLINTLLI